MLRHCSLWSAIIALHAWCAQPKFVILVLLIESRDKHLWCGVMVAGAALMRSIVTGGLLHQVPLNLSCAEFIKLK